MWGNGFRVEPAAAAAGPRVVKKERSAGALAHVGPIGKYQAQTQGSCRAGRAGLVPAEVGPAAAILLRAARHYRLRASTSSPRRRGLTARRREDHSIPGAEPGRPEWGVRYAPHRRYRRPFRNFETLSTSSPPLE